VAYVFRYAHFFLLAIVVANALIYRTRLLRFAAEGGVPREEADRLPRALVLWLGGYVVALGIVQLSAGWPSPMCVHTRPLTDPFVLASWAATAAALGVLAAWIFTRGGAERVSRASPVLGRTARNPGWSARAVRITTVLVFALTAVGGVAARLRPLPEMCAVPSAPAPERQPVW